MPQPTGFKEILAQTGIQTQEALVWTKQNARSLFIGLPREVAMQEHRISLSPDAVGLLVRNGHQVIVETKAGEGAKFTDTQYSDAGATIAYSAEEVFQSDVVLKVQPLTDEEMEYVKNGHTVISSLNNPNMKKE